MWLFTQEISRLHDWRTKAKASTIEDQFKWFLIQKESLYTQLPDLTSRKSLLLSMRYLLRSWVKFRLVMLNACDSIVESLLLLKRLTTSTKTKTKTTHTGRVHMRLMKALRDRHDPHRGRAIDAREKLNSSVAEYGGELLYVNKGARIPLRAMEYSRDERQRLYWDDFSPPFARMGMEDGSDIERSGGTTLLFFLCYLHFLRSVFLDIHKNNHLCLSTRFGIRQRITGPMF